MRIRVGYRQQLLLVLACMAVPAPLLLRSFVTLSSADIDFARQERAGAEYLVPVYGLLEVAESARIEAITAERDSQIATGLDEALIAVDRVDAIHGERLAVNDEWVVLRDELVVLAAQPLADRPATEAAWNEAATDVIDLAEAVIYSSNLVLDPEVDSYGLMDAAAVRHLELLHQMGDGVTAEVFGLVATPYRNVTAALIAGGALESSLSDMDTDYRTALAEANGPFDDQLGESLAAADAALLAFEAELAVAAGRRNVTEESAATLLALRDEATVALRALNAVTIAELDRLLAQRIDRLRTDEVQTFAIVALAMALGICSSVWFFIRTSRTMDRLNRASGALAQSSGSLEVVSSEMHGTVSTAGRLTTSVVGSADDVDEFAQQAADANEQLRASIGEIATNASHAVSVSSHAVDVAGQANDAVSELGQASQDISSVVALIVSIADETNLLALNAAIEAARAGDAGRGFAVVANEVKELATGTARATADIGAKVNNIQFSVERARVAISDIVDIVRDIEESQTSIANAAEQQAATTTEMAQTMRELADGSQQISADVRGVAGAIDGAATSAATTDQASADLSQVAAELEQLVRQLT